MVIGEVMAHGYPCTTVSPLQVVAAARGRGISRGVSVTPQRKVSVMLGLIVSLLIIGLIAGAIARLLIPGRQDISIPATIAVGILGSFVGGFLGYALFHHDAQDGFFQPSGIIGSIIGAVIVLLIWMRMGTHRTVR